MKKKIYISLEDGTVFQGYRFGADGEVQGELCASTSMVGYTEALTDPAYCGQVLVQTFPLIGNYGVMHEDMESERIWVNAYIVREVCSAPSNFRLDETLDGFLKRNGTVGVYGIDTRCLTKTLREKGTMRCYIGDKPLSAEQCQNLHNAVTECYTDEVTVKEIKSFTVNNSKGRLALLDMGGRRSQLNNLLQLGYSVVRFPARVTAEEILVQGFDGVVVGDGPGDPLRDEKIITEVKKLLGKLPILGLGKGHLLVALASGAQTQKQKYGHHGDNQPAKCLQTGKVYVTAQNHGYEVVLDSVKKENVWFTNVNDGSCEGLFCPELRALTVAFDPQSCGVASEKNIVFDAFERLMKGETVYA